MAGPALDGELQVDEADHVEREREAAGVAADRVECGGSEIDSGEYAGGVTGVDSGLLDVLHDAGDDDIGAIAERVDVDFDRVLEEMVDEDGTLLRVLDGFFHVAGDAFAVESDDHGTTAEDVGGADEDRVADALGSGDGFFNAGGDDAGRLRNL